MSLFHPYGDPLGTAAESELTVDERAAVGRQARKQASRDSQGEWAPASDRPDPLSLLEEQAKTRVPDLVPVRYGRMMASPFAFFRGGALIMAWDLAHAPTSGLTVQACGDAHISNFGLYASRERQLVFDVNDFDETNPAPWDWDVRRMVASIEIAGRDNGFTKKQRTRMVRQATKAYRTAMAEFAGQGNLEIWYSYVAIRDDLAYVRSQLDKQSLQQVQRVVDKALTKDSRQALTRLTKVVDGERRFISDPPLIVPITELLTPEKANHYSGDIHTLMQSARENLPDERRMLLDRYRGVDIARKVVGVGSVGTRTSVILMTGRDENDVLLLQVKEAEASVLERFVGPSRFAEHGERVVIGQRRMQALSDVFLTWGRLPRGLNDDRPHDFYFRQLRDWKGSWDPSEMNPTGMEFYSSSCGRVLARAHARTGDPIAIAAYLGDNDRYDQAMSSFASAYADQNEKDHAELVAAVKAGRITAQQA